MPALFSHMTAADFWRKVYSAGKAPAVPSCPVPRQSLTCAAEDIWCQAPGWVTPDFVRSENGVLHVTVCTRADRRKSDSHVCHLWQADFPEGSFYRFNDEAFVASPAFTFVQLGQTLSLAQLIAFGDEICGLYSFNDTAERGFRQRSIPLATVSQLRCAVEGARGTRGLVNTRKALDAIVANAASPLETAIVMLLSLPYRHGGYGLPVPLMNHVVELDNAATRIARRKRLVADLCWPNRRIDLEFHGERDHTGAIALHSDRARTNALSSMKYTVIEITSQQVFDLAAFESVALRLGKLLEKRIAKEYRGALPQRVALRNELFTWNRANGRPVP